MRLLKLDRKLLFGKSLFLEDARRIRKMVVSLNAASRKASRKKARDFLSSVGCDMIQGHYYGKPMPKIEVSEWAKKKFE